MARKPKKNDEVPEPSNNGTATPSAVAEAPAAPAQTTPPAEVRNAPTKVFSCPVSGGGTLEAAIWQKVIKIDNKDVTVFSVTLHKNYRTDLGEWKSTNYLRGSELHVAIRLLSRCETFILDARTAEQPEW